MTGLIGMWLKEKKKDVRPNTFATYDMQVNRHILPYFEKHDKLVSEVTTIDINSFYKYQLKNGVRPNTLLKHHSNMIQIFKYAVQNSLIPYNPAKGAKLPKKQRFKGDYYDAHEIDQLLTKIKGHILEVPVTLAVFLGLRREEIAGLRWQAIDFDKKTISINHTTVLTKAKITNVDNTKNASSNRTLPLSDQLIRYLKDIRKKQLENQLKYGKDYIKSDYVCVWENGERIKPNYISKKWTEFVAQNNLRKIRFHDLRHTCATLLISGGCNIKDVQDWLGHSSLATTADIYGHLSMDREQEMAKQLSQRCKLMDV